MRVIYHPFLLYLPGKLINPESREFTNSMFPGFQFPGLLNLQVLYFLQSLFHLPKIPQGLLLTKAFRVAHVFPSLLPKGRIV